MKDYHRPLTPLGLNGEADLQEILLTLQILNQLHQEEIMQTGTLSPQTLKLGEEVLDSLFRK